MVAYDADRICRVCIKKRINLHSIFDETYCTKDTPIIAKILEKLTRSKVESSDSLPHKVCMDCLKKSQKAYRFCLEVELSHQKLLKYFNEKPAEKINPAGELVNDDQDVETATQNEKVIYHFCKMCKINYANLNEYKLHRVYLPCCRYGTKVLKGPRPSNFFGDNEELYKFQCNLCQQYFAKKSHLKRHIEVMHRLKSIPTGLIDNNLILRDHIPTPGSEFVETTFLEVKASRRKSSRLTKNTSNDNSFVEETIESEDGSFSDAINDAVMSSTMNDDKHDNDLICGDNCEPYRDESSTNSNEVAGEGSESIATATPIEEIIEDIQRTDQIIENVETFDKNECLLSTDKDQEMEYIEELNGESKVDFQMDFIDESRQEEYIEDYNVKKEPLSSDEFQMNLADMVKTEYSQEVFADETLNFDSDEILDLNSSINEKENNSVNEKNSITAEEERKKDSTNAEKKNTNETKPRRVRKRQKKKYHLPCPVCGKIFGQHYHLKRHMALHTNERPYACSLCELSFKMEEQLKVHFLNIHAEKEFECSECELTFVTQKKLKEHQLRKHSEEGNAKPFQCSYCTKAFATKRYLEKHLLLHTSEIYACQHCEEKFCIKKVWQAHEKAHTAGSKKFLCNVCGDCFVKDDYLKEHMRRHNGEKPYKCNYCEKEFPTATDLKMHERYHTGTKPHVCTICNKTFHNLSLHMRTHTGERPYKCNRCPKAFTQSNDLKSHIRRHTGERFSCQECHESYLQMSSLRQHVKNVHGLTITQVTGR